MHTLRAFEDAENRKVFANRLIALLCHLFGRRTHHHPVFVFDWLSKQCVSNGAADAEDLHGHLAEC